LVKKSSTTLVQHQVTVSSRLISMKKMWPVSFTKNRLKCPDI